MRYKNVSNSNISIPLFHTYSLTPVNGNTYTFFQHLASKLQECSSQPVTGSDQEKAMCKATIALWKSGPMTMIEYNNANNFIAIYCNTFDENKRSILLGSLGFGGFENQF